MESDYLKEALDFVGSEKSSSNENDNDDSDYPGRTPRFVKDEDEVMPIIWDMKETIYNI